MSGKNPKRKKIKTLTPLYKSVIDPQLETVHRSGLLQLGKSNMQVVNIPAGTTRV